MKKTLSEAIIGKPLKPVKIRLVIFAILIIILADIGQPFFDSDTKYALRVKPSDTSSYQKNQIREHTSSEITQAGVLSIKNPDIFDRLLYKTNKTGSFTTSLSYLIILIILFKYADKLQFDDKEIFGKKIWKPILIIGVIIFSFTVINIAKDFILPHHIKKITKGEFIPDERFSNWAQFFTGIILLNFSIVFKRGSELQQEQDLTV